MCVVGIATPTKLGELCEVSRQMAARWMQLIEPNISVKHLMKLSAVLRCRMRWLCCGDCSPTVPFAELDRREELFAVLAKMGEEKIDEWIRLGQKLAIGSAQPQLR